MEEAILLIDIPQRCEGS